QYLAEALRKLSSFAQPRLSGDEVSFKPIYVRSKFSLSLEGAPQGAMPKHRGIADHFLVFSFLFVHRGIDPWSVTGDEMVSLAGPR
ncbi:MAG: hypothetical protein WBR30_04890, partial [Candidatus Sulfotelmatobacter sp.]